jgi:hydrogenase-4 component H
MRYPKLRELKEAVTALIKGPCTTKYPFSPHHPAKRFRGKPVYSNDGCIACAACALVCPARAIEARDKVCAGKVTRRMVLHLDECHFCGQCSALCTTRADTPPGIKHTTEFDLAGFDRRDMISSTDDKELVLCEICGDVITAKAHLQWLARRLGPLAFSNPTLFIESLKSLGFAETVASAAKEYILRSDRIKVLCAKCRRAATIEKY